MRPVRIIATLLAVAALAVTGCASPSADQTAAPSSSAPSSAPTTQPTTTAATARPTAGTARTTTTTVASPTTASCALFPTRGPAGARVTLSCRGFAPSEPVQVMPVLHFLTPAGVGGHTQQLF